MSQAPLELPNAAATRVRYTVLAWFCGLSMITYIDRVCIKQVQGDMQRDLGLTGSQFAWAFSAFALAYALFEIPTGWLGDRLGPKKVLVRIVLCWLFFTALTGLVVRHRPWTASSVHALLCSSASSSAPARRGPTRTSPAARATGSRSPSAAGPRGWSGRSAAGAARRARADRGAHPAVQCASGWQGWRFGFVLLAVLGLVWVWGFVVWFRDQPRDHPAVNAAELALIERGGGGSRQAGPAELGGHAHQPHAVGPEHHVLLQQRRLVRLHHLRHQVPANAACTCPAGSCT